MSKPMPGQECDFFSVEPPSYDGGTWDAKGCGDSGLDVSDVIDSYSPVPPITASTGFSFMGYSNISISI